MPTRSVLLTQHETVESEYEYTSNCQSYSFKPKSQPIVEIYNL